MQGSCPPCGSDKHSGHQNWGRIHCAKKHFYNSDNADQYKHCVSQSLPRTINVKAILLPVRYVVAELSFARWPFATQLSPLTQPCGDVSAAYFFLDMLKSHPGDPFNCPYNLGDWMAFPLKNTSSALLPSSLGGHKLCLFVFWALPPFTLPVHHWATVLCMSKLPKHLSVICEYWHKPSVNKFLIPVWRRVAFGWSVQFADFFIAGNQLQQPDFHSAHTPCLGEAQLMLYMVTADFSFSKSVSSFSLHTSISSHPPPQRAFLHPVVLARSVWLQTWAKPENDLSWFTNFCSWKRGLWGLTVNIPASSSSWSEAGVQMQPTMRFLMLLKSTSFGLALILLCSGGNCKGWK